MPVSAPTLVDPSCCGGADPGVASAAVAAAIQTLSDAVRCFVYAGSFSTVPRTAGLPAGSLFEGYIGPSTMDQADYLWQFDVRTSAAIVGINLDAPGIELFLDPIKHPGAYFGYPTAFAQNAAYFADAAGRVSAPAAGTTWRSYTDYSSAEWATMAPNHVLVRSAGLVTMNRADGLTLRWGVLGATPPFKFQTRVVYGASTVATLGAAGESCLLEYLDLTP